MFYSHQLLARKAPLGQIWMAATMHAKINRRKLDKLNIIKICEEILNPSIPMALRLSGILMGGVVIVYERKVKLLYDDVTRLLVEINEAWKVKSVRDPTVLPKRKIQATKEKITLPETQAPDAEVGDVESLLDDSNANATMSFQHTAYFAMRLDNVDEPYINDASKDDGGEFQNFHQADAANITLFERFDSFQTSGHLFDHFERFDIEGEESNMNNTTTAECTQMPANLEASPQPPEEPQRAADEIHDQHPEDKTNQPRDENKEISQCKMKQHKEQQAPARKKARRVPAFKMDCEQTMIPGRVYQTWLQDAGDIVSKRGRKRKRQEILSTMKIANLMDLPSLVLICGLVEDNGEVHYPEPLMELWTRSNQPRHDSPSGRTSPPLPPEPSMSSSPHGAFYNPVSDELPFGDIHNGVGLESFGAAFEKLRTNIEENLIPAEILVDGKRTNLTSNGLGINEPSVMVTPGNSGDEVRSIPSAGSGYSLNPHDSEVNSLRSSKRRTTSSKNSSGGLEPVRENLEEHFSLNYEPKFKLSRLSENGSTPEQELLVETGPTQTPIPPSTPYGDQLTKTIKTQMKSHFETPGAPEIESINKLAKGMNRKGAALLFYQTCVLATLDVLKVEQKEPYADILISKGANM